MPLGAGGQQPSPRSAGLCSTSATPGRGLGRRAAWPRWAPSHGAEPLGRKVTPGKCERRVSLDRPEPSGPALPSRHKQAEDAHQGPDGLPHRPPFSSLWSQVLQPPNPLLSGKEAGRPRVSLWEPPRSRAAEAGAQEGAGSGAARAGAQLPGGGAPEVGGAPGGKPGACLGSREEADGNGRGARLLQGPAGQGEWRALQLVVRALNLVLRAFRGHDALSGGDLFHYKRHPCVR